VRAPRDITLPARAAPIIPVLLATAVGLLLLAVARGLTFRNDEWTFLIQRRDITIDALLIPWNEHLTLVPALLYALLTHAFGVQSYVPFLLPVVALHIVLVAGTFLLLRGPLGWVLATGAATVLAVPGAGSENLLWAFQMGFLASLAGSMAAVAGARAMTPTPLTRAATVGGALIAVASSAVGLFSVGSILLWAIGSRRRYAAVDLAIPLLVWVAWFVAYGRTGLQSVGHPFSAEALSNVIPYVSAALSSGFGDALSVGISFGAVAASGALALLVLAWIRGHDVLGPAAFAVGILGMYVTVALFRSQLGQETIPGRYAYVLEVFVILGLALLPHVPGLPPWARSSRTVLLFIGLVLLITMGHATTAVGVASRFVDTSSTVRTRLAVADALRTSPDLDPNALVLPEVGLGVSVSDYRSLVDDAGSPARRRFRAIPRLPIEQRLIADEEISTLLQRGFRWEPYDSSGTPVAPRVVDTVRGTWALTGACGTFTPTGGDSWMSMRLAGGTRIAVTSNAAGTMGVYPVVFGTYASPILRRLDLPSEKPMAFALPWLPGGRDWLVRLDSPPNADKLSICEIR
jgi:hypothetical protein